MSEDRKPCECCHGTGQLVCSTCGGLGARLIVVREIEDEEWDECPECRGHKGLDCPQCHGIGSAAPDRNVA